MRDRWTPELDARLIALRKEFSGSETAKRLGPSFTRCMVIARENRLREIIFPSDKARGHRHPRKIRADRLKRLRRNEAIIKAVKAGRSRNEVARAYGVTRRGLDLITGHIAPGNCTAGGPIVETVGASGRVACGVGR